MSQFKIVFIGLSLSSSWGNGHATTYRALLKALNRQEQDLLFLERDVPWYAGNRDMPEPDFCRFALYESLDELRERWADAIREADAVVVGSYVPDGPEVCDFVLREAQGARLFYDIDTPVTLACLQEGGCEYLRPDQVAQFDAYLSFSGGKTLDVLRQHFGARHAEAFYCSVDPDLYHPMDCEAKWDLGYLGTYSDDRQPPLDRLMLEAARQLPDRRFVVAGPQYPDSIRWPDNVQRIEHLPPRDHKLFYNEQRFTQNITRRDMVRLGHSPSVRLYEAAACGTPIISDHWVGLDELFEPDREILIARDTADTLRFLRETSEEARREIGRRAREKVLAAHTSDARAGQLLNLLERIASRKTTRPAPTAIK